jgi:hypothetical protein
MTLGQERRLRPERATNGSIGIDGSRPIDILFVLRALDSLRYFQSTLELLIERGHRVRLLLEERRESNAQLQWLRRMKRHANFSTGHIREREDAWEQRADSLRAAMEYVHFLGPVYRGRTRYAERAILRSPAPTVEQLAGLPLLRTPTGVRLLYAILSAIVRVLPESGRAARYLERRRPDVVVVSVRGSRASAAAAYTRAAKRLGIPVVNCVASWDNLTTRPRVVEIPHAMVVWNETQVREAVEIHHMPEERLVVTGAPNFDDWFTWKPRPRAEFLTQVGLDPNRPVVLWVGTALNPGEPAEAEFALRWVKALRSSEDPALREVGVLIRPHPLQWRPWLSIDWGALENVAVWPRRGRMPIDREQKGDYYDSIFHSRAVVGINTSAMIEASIIGRPVLTIIAPEHHHSQLGTLHFSYLLESNGGALRVARSVDEHLVDLASILAGRSDYDAEAARQFVARFVRPQGLDRSATPVLVDVLERLARTEPEPERDSVWVTVVRGTIRLPEKAAGWLSLVSRRTARARKRWRRRLRSGLHRLAMLGARARRLRGALSSLTPSNGRAK